ncbi:MAG TPA: hypothetical protein VHC47_15290, partial [Mucilaginibacter sp.]|nr:hypothetical protein [Mucilaginibacter sp.]
VKGGLAAVLLLGLAAFVYALWEVAGTGQAAVFYGFMFLMAGVPFYVWMAYKKHKDKASPTGEI